MNQNDMRIKYLFGILMLFLLTEFCLSACCADEKNNKIISEEINNALAKRLLHEVDSILKFDSAFWSQTFNSQGPHTASEDLLILQKLDSAILLMPNDKVSYIQKYKYLVACRKPEEILVLLRQMDSQLDLIQGDFLCLKGVLEYHKGDSINGEKSFQRADKAYHMEIIKCSSTDSLRYASLKLSKSLNLSLMKNDFSIFRNELNVFHKTFPQIGIGSMTSIQCITNREEYYHKLFTVK